MQIKCKRRDSSTSLYQRWSRRSLNRTMRAWYSKINGWCLGLAAPSHRYQLGNIHSRCRSDALVGRSIENGRQNRKEWAVENFRLINSSRICTSRPMTHNSHYELVQHTWLMTGKNGCTSPKFSAYVRVLYLVQSAGHKVHCTWNVIEHFRGYWGLGPRMNSIGD